jgi:hypothetical protein
MIRYRIPPLRRWPHMAGLLARCGVLQVRIRWGCFLAGTTVAEVRREMRLRQLTGREG